MGLIRFYGVSNCEDIAKIHELKTRHNIYANQVQARPPHGKISGRQSLDFQHFVSECNKIDVKIMLFASISAVFNSDLIGWLLEKKPEINKYYIQKYIKDTLNVLIVGSVSGDSLELNLKDINSIIKDNQILSESEITEIEQNLSNTTLAHM